MGQCISAPSGGETEEVYRARWQAGGLGEGLAAGYESNRSNFKKQELRNPYSTTVGVLFFCNSSRDVFLA